MNKERLNIIKDLNQCSIDVRRDIKISLIFMIPGIICIIMFIFGVLPDKNLLSIMGLGIITFFKVPALLSLLQDISLLEKVYLEISRNKEAQYEDNLIQMVSLNDSKRNDDISSKIYFIAAYLLVYIYLKQGKYLESTNYLKVMITYHEFLRKKLKDIEKISLAILMDRKLLEYFFDIKWTPEGKQAINKLIQYEKNFNKEILLKQGFKEEDIEYYLELKDSII